MTNVVPQEEMQLLARLTVLEVAVGLIVRDSKNKVWERRERHSRFR